MDARTDGEVIVEELLPVLLGALAGFLSASLVRRRLPTAARIAIAGVAGGLATLITGEFHTSLAYLLIDVPLGIAGATIVSELWTRRLTPPTRAPNLARLRAT